MSNYPAGAKYDSRAPYNQEENKEEIFDVCISQTMSKRTTVETDDYNVEEGMVDTSDTNWMDAYTDEHYTIPQIFKRCILIIEKELTNSSGMSVKIKQEYRKLINEMKGWEEDECEVIKE